MPGPHLPVQYDEQRPCAHQILDLPQQRSETQSGCIPQQHPCRCVKSGPMHERSANSVFIHPAAVVGCSKIFAGAFEGTQWKGPAMARGPLNVGATNRVPTSAFLDVDSDAHISLAAKQLKTQIDEFVKVYAEFYRVYEKEVTSIKLYVDDSVLQRAWSQKIEHNEKYNTGHNQEHKQLSTQRKMLAACLIQIDDATRSTVTPSSDDLSRYDRRAIYLEKVRAAGDRVLRLAEMAMSSRAACEDLLTETSELRKLVDPKSKDAKLLYQFDKRESLNTKDNSRDTKTKGGDGQQEGNQADRGDRNEPHQGDDAADDQNGQASQNDGSW
ncbi:hypothetical protein DL764_007015 [Monosporascus ibericus]|uniref:Uncharacterized protein n=1 Tax=Monosporascus ibericus TaxID=155417 RepID=A0A4Q4T6C9_9PEZI|nr:hypothetical protein DL764_007015 [Monosporascus ibericus]